MKLLASNAGGRVITKSWTINTKLWALCGCFMANVFLVGIIGFWTTNNLKQHIDNLVIVQISTSQNTAELRNIFVAVRSSVYAGAWGAQIKDSKIIETSKFQVVQETKDFEQIMNELEKANSKKQVKEGLLALSTQSMDFFKTAKDFLSSAGRLKSEDLTLFLKSFQDKFDAINAENSKLRTFVMEDVKADAASFAGDAIRSKVVMNFIVIFSMFLSLFNSWWVIRGVSKGLGKIISDLSLNARQVAKASSGMKGNASALSNSTNAQASALQETAASFDEISAMIMKTGENSHRLEESTKSSQVTAEQGKVAVSGMLSAIEQIRVSNAAIMTQIEDSNNRITGIVKMIGEIGSKTKIINDIVFQTKLLSFNASVEAARAGEHGRGFAVVAEEVGSLAQMSGNAAREISDLLSSSVLTVESIVRENKDKVQALISAGKEKIELGITVAEQCGSSLDEIVRQSAEVGTMVDEIIVAIREQSQGINEVARAINLLDRSTSEITGSSTATSDTAEILMKQASSLNDVVITLEQMTVGKIHLEGFSIVNENEKPGTVVGIGPLKDKNYSDRVISLSKRRSERKSGAANQPEPEKKESPKNEPVLKKAAGTENIKPANAASSTPKSNDPRFEEV